MEKLPFTRAKHENTSEVTNTEVALRRLDWMTEE